MKLRPPKTREGLIQRRQIIDRLMESVVPIISVTAPPGYGKTSVLGQFQAALDVPAAWLTIDESDSDPALLMSSLIGALSSANVMSDTVVSATNLGSDPLVSGVNQIASAISTTPGVLIVDQVDHLGTRAALDVIGAVMTRLPESLRVVVASRTTVGLPVPLLRSRGSIMEVTSDDLAMDSDEASELLRLTGIDPEPYLDAVMERTEGWPAGIYLTALAIKAGSPGPETSDIHGNDRYLADYLSTELLGPLSEETMDFLLRSSILRNLSGPLCDYVLQTSESSRRLDDLENANLLIVPMDRTRSWYRYHSLLQDYLRSSLERTAPDTIAALHARAATWFEERGMPDRAIEHAQQAGEEERFALMVAASARRVYAEGRMERLSTWITSLEESKEIVRHPELAAQGAFARALEGDAAGSERVAIYAFTDGAGNDLDTTDLGPFALMLRSYQIPKGPRQAMADAKAARLGFSVDNMEWLHTALGAEALATEAAEGKQAAEVLWTDGQWRSEAIKAHPFTSIAYAERALSAIERDDWDLAEALTDDALTLIGEGGLEGYITSALPSVIASRIASRRGETEQARILLTNAVAIRPRLTVALPIFAVQNLHEMAKAFIELADVAGARRVMREAADILALRPRLGTFADAHETLQTQLSALPAGSIGASSLTKAELRLLPLLVTHLSYPEIGERLYVSRHTVKTQAMSVYRKLGVSSRDAAVTKAREIGLISL